MSFSESISNAAKAVGNFVVNAYNTTTKVYIPVVINKVVGAHQFIADSKALNPIVQVVGYVAGPALTLLADDTVSRFFSSAATKQLVSRVTVVIGFSLTALAIGSLAASWPLTIGLTALAFIIGSIAWNILSRLISSDESKANEKGANIHAANAARITDIKKEIEALKKDIEAQNKVEAKDEAALKKLTEDTAALDKLELQLKKHEKIGVYLATTYDIKTEEEKKKEAEEAKKKEADDNQAKADMALLKKLQEIDKNIKDIKDLKEEDKKKFTADELAALPAALERNAKRIEEAKQSRSKR